MSTVAEIKTAIEQLPMEQRAALVAELCGWIDDDWDHRMKSDAKSGKFTTLNEDAAHTYQAGLSIPLDDCLWRTTRGFRPGLRRSQSSPAFPWRRNLRA